MVTRNKFLALALTMVLTLALVGCATTHQNQLIPKRAAYNTLKSAKIMKDAILTIAGQAYKEGKLTDKQKDEIIATGEKFRSAYNLAVDALILGASYEESVKQAKSALAFLADTVDTFMGLPSSLITDVQRIVR